MEEVNNRLPSLRCFQAKFEKCGDFCGFSGWFQCELAFFPDCSSLFFLDTWQLTLFEIFQSHCLCGGLRRVYFHLFAKKVAKCWAPVLWKTIGQLTCRQQTILPTSLYNPRPSSRPLPHWKSLKATFQSFVPHYVMFIFCHAQKKWCPEILGQNDHYLGQFQGYWTHSLGTGLW